MHWLAVVAVGGEDVVGAEGVRVAEDSAAAIPGLPWAGLRQ